MEATRLTTTSIIPEILSYQNPTWAIGPDMAGSQVKLTEKSKFLENKRIKENTNELKYTGPKKSQPVFRNASKDRPQSKPKQIKREPKEPEEQEGSYLSFYPFSQSIWSASTVFRTRKIRITIAKPIATSATVRAMVNKTNTTPTGFPKYLAKAIKFILTALIRSSIPSNIPMAFLRVRTVKNPRQKSKADKIR